MTLPMKPDVKELWLTALRSGEYEQTTGVLRVERDGKDGYCCLGVLCELAAKQGVIPKAEAGELYYGTRDYVYGTEDDNNDATLPKSVAEWAGLYATRWSDDPLPDSSPEVTVPAGDPQGDEDYPTEVELTGLNDTTDLGFKGIADYIEKYL